MAKKWFGTNELVIENEFALPHFTIARVLFGPFVSTVVTFATPINDTSTMLYVKTYRNFWFLPPEKRFIPFFDDLVQMVGDKISRSMMEETMRQDKWVIEGIRKEKMDGRFNMKYDKLQNVYRQLYKKWIQTSFEKNIPDNEDNDTSTHQVK